MAPVAKVEEGIKELVNYFEDLDDFGKEHALATVKTLHIVQLRTAGSKKSAS